MSNRARIIWFTPLLALVLAGCATTPKIDWKTRVGTYTYDQAITELGPPDKAAKLTDGTTVAEWLKLPAQIVVSPQPYFATPGYYYYPLPPMVTTTRFPAIYWRLTFAPDGRLKQFKEITR
jgi:hypothetical protein